MRGSGGKGKGDEADARPVKRAQYVPQARKLSEKFKRYYKAQHILPDAEWAVFEETLMRPLPVALRINPVDPLGVL